jgi:putative ABC transport system permease protein
MVVAVFAIAILSSVIAGLYPAYRICKTNPAIHLKTQ